VKNSQQGSVIVGIIIGVVLGLAVALAVAVYVTKVPVPFLHRGQSRTAEQDAAETRKNRD
jgi:cell division protein FtsN